MKGEVQMSGDSIRNRRTRQQDKFPILSERLTIVITQGTAIILLSEHLDNLRCEDSKGCGGNTCIEESGPNFS